MVADALQQSEGGFAAFGAPNRQADARQIEEVVALQLIDERRGLRQGE